MSRFFSILLILGLLFAVDASAEEARIRQVNALAHDDAVSVSFVLEHAFDDSEIISSLQSGLPTGFVYHVELIRKKKNWFDDTLMSARIDVISTYNSVTREYLLNYRRDKLLVRSEVLSSLEELKRRMTQIAEENLFPLGGRKPRKLVVRVRADLSRGFFLYVVPWDVSTNWAVTRVKTQATTP